MIRLLQIVLVATMTLLVASCGCPLLEPANLTDRRVREATITQFNPGWNRVTNQPVPAFSIHNFLFPNTIESSGTLPNDLRVTDGKDAFVGSTTFIGTTPPDTLNYTAEFYTSTPSNGQLIGDVLVVSVDTTVIPHKARLRFFGALARFGDKLFSGGASDFTDFLEAHQPDFDNLAASATAGGSGLAGGGSSVIDSVRVLDPSGKNVSATVAVPAADRAAFDNNNAATDVLVCVGEVYYYKARNGVEFGLLIEDVFRSSLPPNQRRVTIKFAELRSLQVCNPS